MIERNRKSLLCACVDCFAKMSNAVLCPNSGLSVGSAVGAGHTPSHGKEQRGMEKL